MFAGVWKCMHRYPRAGNTRITGAAPPTPGHALGVGSWALLKPHTLSHSVTSTLVRSAW